MSAGRFYLHRGNDPDTGRPPTIPALLGRYGLSARVVRAPHHTVSNPALIGRFFRRSDETLKREPERARFLYQAGEITLADRGVLILDDLPEFRRECIASIGHAFRAQSVRLSLGFGEAMVDISVCFDVLAVSTDCPCGHPDRAQCRCTKGQKQSWEARLVRLRDLIILPREPAKLEERDRALAARPAENRRHDSGKGFAR